MFAASLSNASLLWNLDDCSLADMFQEDHNLAAIATLPYYSLPLKQVCYIYTEYHVLFITLI